MIVETSLLSGDARLFEGEEQASVLEIEDDAFIRAEGPVRYNLQASLVSSELLVRGSLELDLSCCCARCDQWFPHRIRVQDFSRSYKLTSENESIDLTDDIREDILLALPMNFICSSSCSGLCPQCGANLNKQTCSCAKQENRKGWNVLDQLDIR